MRDVADVDREPALRVPRILRLPPVQPDERAPRAAGSGARGLVPDVVGGSYAPVVLDLRDGLLVEAVPEDAPFWTHTLEGSDDMPAHIKASLMGPSLTVPVGDGRLPPRPH